MTHTCVTLFWEKKLKATMYFRIKKMNSVKKCTKKETYVF